MGFATESFSWTFDELLLSSNLVERLLDMNDSTGRMELSLAAATSRWRVQNSHRGSDLTARMTQARYIRLPRKLGPEYP